MPDVRGHGPFRAMNRTVNPLLAGVLRSPLHRLASGRLALVTYTGRKSGRRYTIPVLYRDNGSEITIAVGWPERKVWWRNLTGKGGQVTLVQGPYFRQMPTERRGGRVGEDRHPVFLTLAVANQ